MAKTERDVELWMVAAERADPRTRNPGEARPLSWPDRFVENPDHRKAVKLWVWCKANGYSLHEVCRRRGIPDTTARRHARLAIERITRRLNHEESRERHTGLAALAS